jgi:molybdopterin-synthase adenylyltransferase
MLLHHYEYLHLLMPSFLQITGTTLVQQEPPQFLARVGAHEAFSSEIPLSGPQCYLLSLADGTETTARRIAQVAEAFGAEAAAELPEWIVQQVENGLLTFAEKLPEAMPYAKDRYARHDLFYASIGAQPKVVRERLARARVTVLGVGGIGTWVSYMLAAAGVGHLRLVDGDQIEESNLTRQVLFGPADLGRIKVEVAAERLRAQRPDLVCETCVLQFSAEADMGRAIGGADLVVLSANTPAELNEWMDRYAVQHRVPWLRAGYAHTSAMCGPLLVPGSTACQACVTRGRHDSYLEQLPLVSEINHRYQVASFGPINGMSASLAANQAIAFLAGLKPDPATLGALVVFDSQTLTIDRFPLERDMSCPRCSPLFAEALPAACRAEVARAC